MTDPAAGFKAEAAEAAVDEVRSGMAVGLGTGSTAIFATRRIGARLAAGELSDLVGYATSNETRREAEALGIPMLAMELHRRLDLTIDGADEVDPDLNLIKGGGGAHLREKLVAQASERELIVVDESKLSPRLGTRHPLPLEVLEFGWSSQARYVESLGASVERAMLAADGRAVPHRPGQPDPRRRLRADRGRRPASPTGSPPGPASSPTGCSWG